MSTRRTSLTLVAAGLVGGLALGVTGFARAADPSPSPSPGQQLEDRKHDMRKGPFGGFGKGRHLRGAGGLVTAVDSDSLTVQDMRGKQTIGLTSSTTYYAGRTKATRSVVEKGAVVRVRLVDPRSAKKVAAVVTVMPAHLDGWVARVGDDTLTVTDPSGFTRTIRTSGSTSYVKDGATGSRDAMRVGTFVRAVGKVADDGTSLEATRVATGRPDKSERPDARDGGFTDGPAPGAAAPGEDEVAFPVA